MEGKKESIAELIKRMEKSSAEDKISREKSRRETAEMRAKSEKDRKELGGFLRGALQKLHAIDEAEARDLDRLGKSLDDEDRQFKRDEEKEAREDAQEQKIS